MSDQQVVQLQQQAAAQLESLLYIGFKLDLQQLLQRVVFFVRNNALLGSSLLENLDSSSELSSMFSPRVLAAAGSSTARLLLLKDCTQHPLKQGFGIGTTFGTPVFAADEDALNDQVMFKAALLHDFLDFAKGTTVAVNFDVRTGKMQIRGNDSDDTDEYAFSVCVVPDGT